MTDEVLVYAKDDGFQLYLVELDVVCIKNHIYLEVCAESSDEAWVIAQDTMSMIKHGDIEVISVSTVKKFKRKNNNE